jgi:hypothetical protein
MSEKEYHEKLPDYCINNLIATYERCRKDCKTHSHVEACYLDFKVHLKRCDSRYHKEGK